MHRAIRLLNEHSLSVISTERQVKNGTIMVRDEVLGTHYTIHTSGYARKRVKAAPMFGPDAINHYQLNKTRLIKKPWKDQYSGKTYHRIDTVRQLLPGNYVELAQMVVNAANAERKRDIALESLRAKGKTDSWFTKAELMNEYQRMHNK